MTIYIHTHTHTHTHPRTPRASCSGHLTASLTCTIHARALFRSLAHALLTTYFTANISHTSYYILLYYVLYSILPFRSLALALVLSLSQSAARTHTHTHMHMRTHYPGTFPGSRPCTPLSHSPSHLSVSFCHARAHTHTHTHSLTTLVPFRALSLAPPLFLPRFPVRVSAGQPRTKDDFVHASCTYDYRGWCRRSCSRRGQRRWSRSCCLEGPEVVA